MSIGIVFIYQSSYIPFILILITSSIYMFYIYIKYYNKTSPRTQLRTGFIDCVLLPDLARSRGSAVGQVLGIEHLVMLKVPLRRFVGEREPGATCLIEKLIGFCLGQKPQSLCSTFIPNTNEEKGVIGHLLILGMGLIQLVGVNLSEIHGSKNELYINKYSISSSFCQ